MRTKIRTVKKTSDKEILEKAYQNYRETGDVKDFMEMTSKTVLSFIKKNLSCDEDIACEFFLHFYENAEKFLNKFELRPETPLVSFLSRFLKNEFMNFRKLFI